MADQEQVAPAEADKAMAPVTTDKAAEQQPQTAPKNEEALTPEMREELRRNLNASKEEALRLKRVAEDESAKRKELEAKLAALQTPSEAQSDELQFSDTDIEVLDKLLEAREAKKQEALRLQQEQEEAARREIDKVYAEKQAVAVNQWLGQHPEYNKPGDPDSDKKWRELEEKTKILPPPLNPEDWSKVLDLALKELNSNNALERGKSLGYAQANLQEQSRLGGGSSEGSSASKTKRTPEQQAVLDELRELRPQYFQ